MREHPTVPAGAGDVELVVAKACRLLVEAKDRRSGTPIPRFVLYGRVTGASGARSALILSATQGSVDVFRTAAAAATYPVRYEFDVQADGYANARVSVDCDRKGVVHGRALRLDPKETIALPFKVLSPWGQELRAFKVWISPPDGRDFAPVRLRRAGGGRTLVEIPPGTWLVKVLREQALPGVEPPPRLLKVEEDSTREVVYRLRSEATPALDIRAVPWQSGGADSSLPRAEHRAQVRETPRFRRRHPPLGMCGSGDVGRRTHRPR